MQNCLYLIFVAKICVLFVLSFLPPATLYGYMLERLGGVSRANKYLGENRGCHTHCVLQRKRITKDGFDSRV